MREREFRIERERRRAGTEAFVAPRRVSQAEQVSPVVGLERERASRRANRARCVPRADEDHGERSVRFGEPLVELDRAPRVLCRPIEQNAGGLIVRSRGFVRREFGRRQPCVRDRVLRIDRDGAFEVGDRGRQLADVQRFDLQPAFDHRAIRLEARRIAAARRSCLRDGDPEFVRKLLGHLVLQVEHLVEAAVHLGVGDRLAARDVHDARRDANAIAVHLEAADDEQTHAQRGGDVLQRAARTARRFDDAPAVDDLEAAERREVRAHRFGDPRGQPRGVFVAAHVREVEHRERVVGDGHRLVAIGGRRLGQRRDRRDEPVALSRDGLDVGRGRGLVAERVAQVRHRLRQRVLGDVGVPPERVEELLLAHQVAGVVEQEE